METTTRRITGLKETRDGYRGVALDHEPMPAADRARRWELCTCEDDSQHDRGCPVHLAWVVSYAAHKGAPDVVGLAHNAADIFAAAWLGSMQYLYGAKKYAYAPGREMLANMLGAQHEITRRRVTQQNQRGTCALETVSRALADLKAARCVVTGRKIVRFKQRPKPMTALLSVEAWVLALPRGATLRVALPGDLDYPDPLTRPDPSTFREPARNDNPDSLSEEIRNLSDVGADRQTGPADLTSWGDEAAFDLTLTFLAGPWMKELIAETGLSGKAAAQWFRNQCLTWDRQGHTINHVRRSLYALLSYVGTGRVRKGWQALICAAVAGRWSPDTKNFDDVDYFDHFQRAAISGIRAVQGGAEPHELPAMQRDGFMEVVQWLNDNGRRATVARSSGAMTGRPVAPEGRAM